MSMVTVYVTIGNSDNRLVQQRWANYCWSVRQIVGRMATEVYFVGFSNPDDSYQNACFSFRLAETALTQLRTALRLVADDYEQDSIALAVIQEVEMVKQWTDKHE